MASRGFWVILLTIVIKSANSHPVETKTHDELKLEIKGIKSEIQELFERINELSSPKKDVENKEATTYHADDRVCLTKDCIAASHHLFKHMDLTVDPCDDFNKFSCGTFIKEFPIPDDKTNYKPAFSPPLDEGEWTFQHY